MPREVTEHVGDGVRRFAGALEHVRVIPVREDLAPPLHHSVQRACDADRQVLDAARESYGIFCLDDEVKMVALDAEVNEPESSATFPVRERFRDGTETAPAAQMPDFPPHSQCDVHRMVP